MYWPLLSNKKGRINMEGILENLSMEEMAFISHMYHFLCLKEFISDNYEYKNEEELNAITSVALEKYDDIETGEMESICIEEAIKEVKERR